MTAAVRFERFRASFSPRAGDSPPSVAEDFQSDVPGWRDLVVLHGGASFNQGLYRLFAPDEVAPWTVSVQTTFPTFAARIRAFGRDWLGRVFAVDGKRVDDGEPLVLMFEPGSGDVLEIPIGFAEFHEAELVDQADAVVAEGFFTEWLASPGGREPGDDECIGYKVPLFLGGSDVISNLEPVDAWIYWSMSSQLLERARALPRGTAVRRVGFVDEAGP
jgi:hypothetical protein